MLRHRPGVEKKPSIFGRRSGGVLGRVAPARRLTAALAGLLLALPFAAVGEEPAPIGHVATLRGAAFAERPDGEVRSLGCRDPIFAGERVVSEDAASVGLLVREFFVQLGAGSALLVSAGEENADLVLEKGAVRIVDPREVGRRTRLRVLDTQARVLGNDLEGYVFDEKAGKFAMLCEWMRPLPVARLEETGVALPGHCAIAKAHEPLYFTPGHEERLGSPTQNACSLGPVFGPIARHLSPSDVAAGPAAERWSSLPALGPIPRRSPCDIPGSGCSTIIEEPAQTGVVPGGAGQFPGP
jgi:hypothetical protein